MFKWFWTIFSLGAPVSCLPTLRSHADSFIIPYLFQRTFAFSLLEYWKLLRWSEQSALIWMRWTLEWACSWRVSTYRRGRWTGQNRGAVTVERKEDDLGISRTLLQWFALSSQDRWPQWRVAYRCISCGRGRTWRNNLAASCAYRHILKNQEGYPPKAMVWDPVEENYLESSSKNARLASTETPIFQV